MQFYWRNKKGGPFPDHPDAMFKGKVWEFAIGDGCGSLRLSAADGFCSYRSDSIRPDRSDPGS